MAHFSVALEWAHHHSPGKRDKVAKNELIDPSVEQYEWNY